MAKVQVQVIVDRQQVDKLATDLDKLNGRKINVGTKEFTHDLQDAGRAATELQGKLTKTVDVWTDGKQVKAVREYKNGIAETTRETTRLVGKNKDVVQTQTQITHNIEKEEAAQRRANAATQEGNAAVKQQGLLYDILGRSLTSFIARMTAYRAVYAGIRAITTGFREALETMKAVDDEMVAVRKVTGFDSYQMAAIENESYRVATKYGANASDYMEGVAEFARAGYLELSGALAELSQKTQIVGDTTAEVANQFLLSVDKAYKFNGSVAKLSEVLDGADIINNKYATSVEKIAQGLGIVAPVAAQMHVGVDELTAALGTITAVTQRSGSEAARALRAIFLNIVGDTKTEIEDGVTWTAGEIEGLQDVIKTYAKDAYDAAQATGSIIDPMEAIRGLSESMKDGLLTEQKLMEMVSDIGGKLRTSQLIALIENFDMYESMLQDYANSAGTVDREVENAMDSWTRKANVLKNTWTEFVRTGLNSQVFKGALDALTWFVERMGTLQGTLTRLIPLIAAIRLHEIAKQLKLSTTAATGFAGALQKIGVSSTALNWVAAALAAIAIAWTAISMAQEDAKIKHQELVNKIYEEADAAKESTDSLLGLYADFNSAKEGSDALAESAKKLAEALGTDIPEGAAKAGEALTQLTREQLLSALDKMNTAKITAGDEFVNSIQRSTGHWDEINAFGTLFQASWNTYAHNGGQLPEELRQLADSLTRGLATREGSAGYQIFDATTLENALKFHDAMVQISDAVDEYVRRTGDRSALDSRYYKQLQDYLIQTKDTYEKFNSAAEELDTQEIKLRFLDLSSAIRVDSVEAYEKLIKTINYKNRGSDEEREALIALAEKYYPQYSEAADEAADAVNDLTDAVDEETQSLFANQDALDENASASERAAAAKKDAEAAVHQFCDALFDETGELTEAGKAALAASDYLAELTQAELNARLEAAKANYANLRAQLAGVSADALKAAYALIALEEASLVNGIVENREGVDMRRLEQQAGFVRNLINQISALESQINGLTIQASKVSGYSGGGGSGGSGGSGGKSSGGKSGGKSSSGSTEDKKLAELKDRITLLKSELALMKERGDSEEDQIKKMREIQEALKAEWEYLEKIKGDKATINGLEKEWWEYENAITDLMEKQAEASEKEAEAQQKVLDAQLALNNALKDRSVRYYNAATGQWEWGANQENVDNARKALEEALKEAGMTMEEWEEKYKKIKEQDALERKAPIGIPLYQSSSAVSNFGSTTYGPSYNFGHISLSEAQARSMTVYDLAMLSGRLAAYS